jgi:hypothetical protein
MTHTITQFEGVVTVRIDGRANALELTQDLKAVLDASTNGPVMVVIDLSLARELGQTVKVNLYRILQHVQVLKVGFSGVSADIGAELKDIIPILARVRPVVIGITEADVRQKLGLVSPTAGRKLTGMLSYLDQNHQTAK